MSIKKNARANKVIIREKHLTLAAKKGLIAIARIWVI